MLASILVAVVFILMLWCGRVTATFAVQRGRSRRTWFAIGSLLFLLFPIPLLVLALLPPRGARMSVAAST